MYKVIILKNNEGENFADFGLHESFNLYLRDSIEVCELLRQLSDYHLSYSLYEFDFAKPDVIDDIKKRFKLV